LPPELRNRIYHFALVEQEREQNGTQVGISVAQPPLTRVNRAMRQETLHYFYGNNHFRLEFESELVVIDKSKAHLRYHTGLETMGAAGYFRLMPMITVAIMSAKDQVMSTGQRIGLQVHIYKELPAVHCFPDSTSSDPLPASDHDWHWHEDKFRNSIKHLNWSSFAEVDYWVRNAQTRYSTLVKFFMSDDVFSIVNDMKLDRLSEVLYFLGRETSGRDHIAKSAILSADQKVSAFL